MKHEHEREAAPGAPAAAASHSHGSESITDLIRQLATDVSTLFGKEMALAKSEVRESVSEMQTAVGAIASGAAIAMAGLVALLMSAVYGLSIILAPWLAALIVGAAALLVGYLMISSAKKKISASAVIPDRTIHSAEQDKETFKRTVQ